MATVKHNDFPNKLLKSCGLSDIQSSPVSNFKSPKNVRIVQACSPLLIILGVYIAALSQSSLQTLRLLALLLCRYYYPCHYHYHIFHFIGGKWAKSHCESVAELGMEYCSPDFVPCFNYSLTWLLFVGWSDADCPQCKISANKQDSFDLQDFCLYSFHTNIFQLLVSL